MSNSSEPEITVNGQRLTEGQALAVRVAVAHLHGEVWRVYRHLALDREAARAFRERLEEVLRMMLQGRPCAAPATESQPPAG